MKRAFFVRVMGSLGLVAAVSATLVAGGQVELGPQDAGPRLDWYNRRSAVRVAQDYALRADDEVREVVVVFGNAKIEGHIVHDMAVVFGNVEFGPNAVVGGSLTVVAGNIVAQPGAVVRRDLAVVGGTIEAPADFASGGEHVVIGPEMFGGRLRAFFPWLTHGLFWGRLIVPNLMWVWTVVATFFLAYLAINVVLERPVHATAETLSERPFSAMVVGFLVLLLTTPVSVLLAVSVIGIAIIPFLLVGLFVAFLIGRVAVMRALGMRLFPESEGSGRAEALRSFVIGFVVLTLAYMVPAIGIATWAMVGVFGLGAATLAVIRAYRRENPAPIPVAWQPPQAPPVAPPSQPIAVPYQFEGTTMPGMPRSESSDSSDSSSAFSAHSGSAQAAVLPGPHDLLMFPRAMFLDRVAAAFLDLILVVMASQFLDRLFRDDAVVLLLVAYHIGFLMWKGTTIGGVICQLRVVRVDGQPIRFVDALVRALSALFSAVVLGLGFFWIIRDPDRQAWHDKIAGTYVVKVPRHFPI